MHQWRDSLPQDKSLAKLACAERQVSCEGDCARFNLNVHCTSGRIRLLQHKSPAQEHAHATSIFSLSLVSILRPFSDDIFGPFRNRI